MKVAKRKLGVVIGLVAVLLLSVTLIGCSSPEKNFVGEWKGVEVSASGMTVNPESLGMTVTLSMKEDKTFNLDMMGTGGSGTWKAKDASTVTLTVNNESIDATLKDKRLTIDIEGNVLVFEKV